MIKINNIVFLYFVIVIFLNCIYFNNSQVLDQEYKSNLNGHIYKVVNKSTDPVTATEYCSSTYDSLGRRGYIATFTSEEEWNWAWERSINKPGSWISGSDTPKTGVWHWSIGSPEELEPWYNLYFDKCYTFCLFGSVEPNLIEGEHWIHTSGSLTFPYLNNNGIKAVISTIVCEYGGLEEPFVPSSPTQGSTITVRGLGGWDIPNLSISFTGRNGTTGSFQCSNIVKINSTHINCDIPTGQGKFNITITDGKKSLSQPQLWHYELPYVGGVFPVFTKGGIATISGANFGTQANLVSVTLGYATPVSCGSITIIKPNEALTCVLAADITEKFLPVTISVSNSKFVSYKAAVYYPTNKLYYSGFVSSSTFTTSMNNYSSALRVDGQVGTIGVFDSIDLFNFMNKTLPTPSSNAPWLLWQNARYEPSTKSWFYLSGPKKDQPLSLVYKSVTGSTPQDSWTKDTRFIINCTDLSIQAYTSSASTFTEFGGYPPTFPENITHQVSPAGAKVDLKIDNYGNVFSTIKVLFRGQELPFERDYINGELDVTIPAGFDGPYEISVQVDSLSTQAKSQFIQYSAPEITNINSVETSGNKITIDGNYFSNTLNNTVLTFSNNVVCNNLTISNSYTQMICDLPAGSGSLDVTVRVSNAVSTVYKYQYQNPTVTSANNIASIGGKVLISGTNFGTVKENIKVLIGSYECTSVEVLTNHKQLSCIAPTGTPGQYGLSVTVSGLVSNSYPVNYFASSLSVIQIDADLQINGQNLPDASLLTIKIGDVDISNYCIGSGSKLDCTDLPLELASGELSISKGTDVYPSIPVILNPFISSISNNLFDTVSDSIIMISGRYFEFETNSIENQIQVIYDNDNVFNSSNVNHVSTEDIILTINGGFGKNHSLLVQLDSTRKSNSVNYSFYKPELLNIVQDGFKIIVSGTNFSSDPNLTKLTFNSKIQQLESIKNNELVFNIDFASISDQILVQVDGQLSNSLDLNIKPILNKVTPNIIPLEGPTVITITGNYLNEKDFNDQDISIEFYYQFTTKENSPIEKLNDCNQIDNQNNQYTYTCEMVSGYGYYSVLASSKFKDSTNLSSNIISKLSFESPIVGLSTSLYENEAGNVTIDIKNYNIDYTQVFIGNKECTNVIEIEKNLVQCYFTADIKIPDGQDSLSIQVSSAGLIGSNNGFVYSLLYDCLNDCSANGQCDHKTGKCLCNDNYYGDDCSDLVSSNDNGSDGSSSNDNHTLPPPIISDDGETIFPGSKINFTVSITHLRELNIFSNTVKVLKLSTINWIERNTNGNHYYYKGNFTGDTAIFELDITYFENETVIEFGGEKLTMPKESIKYQVTISNWSFDSQTNYLQTIYHSKTDKVSTYNCDQVTSTVETGSNQFQIKTGGGVLNAKFSSRMILDDKRYSKTDIITLDESDLLYIDFKSNITTNNNDYHVLTSMNSPWFESKVILDPSFSSFFTFEEKTECGSKNKWKIPVIVVLSVAGAGAIGATSFLVYKSKKLNKKTIDSISMSDR